MRQQRIIFLFVILILLLGSCREEVQHSPLVQLCQDDDLIYIHGDTVLKLDFAYHDDDFDIDRVEIFINDSLVTPDTFSEYSIGYDWYLHVKDTGDYTVRCEVEDSYGNETVEEENIRVRDARRHITGNYHFVISEDCFFEDSVTSEGTIKAFEWPDTANAVINYGDNDSLFYKKVTIRLTEDMKICTYVDKNGRLPSILTDVFYLSIRDSGTPPYYLSVVFSFDNNEGEEQHYYVKGYRTI